MKQYLLTLVICIQGIIIILLFTHIWQSLYKSLHFSINPINPNSIERSPTQELRYFYEPKANTTDTVKREWLDYEPTYTINSDSLNERFEYAISKDNGVYRIITMGDSFTYGLNVSTKENWTELLEDELNRKCTNSKIKKFEVINLGVSGYDTEYELYRYIKRGKKYNPDVILWMLRDFELSKEYMTPLVERHLQEFKKDKGEYLKYKEELSNSGSLEANISDESQVAYAIGMRETRQYFKGEHSYKLQTKSMANFEDIFKKELIYIDISESAIHTGNSSFKEVIALRTPKRPFTYYFQPKFIKMPGDYRLPDYHFNRLGNKLMMEEILSFLSKNTLTTCLP